MGGPERLTRRASQGRLNARERVEHLRHAKDGSRHPGRAVAVCSNDFTLLAATSSRVASDKEAEMKATAIRRGVPIVYFSEAGGARMPDIMGAAGIASFGNSTYYGLRRGKVPMVTAVLGQSYGLPTWNACLSDFVVMLTAASIGRVGPARAGAHPAATCPPSRTSCPRLAIVLTT